MFQLCELCESSYPIARMEFFRVVNNKLTVLKKRNGILQGAILICPKCLHTLRTGGDDYSTIPS